MSRFRKRWLLLVPVALIVVAVAGFAIWASVPVGSPMPEAEAALQSDEQVNVETEDWIVLEPANRDPKAGFVFYPGARVPVEAYAPMGRGVAEAGYLAVIAPMPLNLALLDSDAAAEVVEAYPEIET